MVIHNAQSFEQSQQKLHSQDSSLAGHNMFHEYPPSSSSTRDSTVHEKRLRDTSEQFASFLVHTQTRDVNDLRLQVSFPAPPNSSADAPARPAYFRERTLAESNEILDRIIDASSGRICWTIHRPTRGWYLYLRSSLLPKGAAISLTSAKTVEYDASISPLTFSLTTRLQKEALNRIMRSSAAQQMASDHITESQGHNVAPTLSESQEAAADDLPPDVDIAIATGRENVTETSRGHTRKRSAAGSGTHPVADRKANRISVALTRSPMIPEMPDEQESISSSAKHLPAPHSSCLRTDADLPYSPAEPDNHPHRGGGRGPFNVSANGGLKPYLCTFVLCEGSRRPQGHSRPLDTTKQPLINFKDRQSWARWAWSKLPQELRPELPIGTTKDFSLYWMNPPTQTRGPRPEGNSDPVNAIEVLRFQDQSGWWIWDSQTRGKILLQTEAVEALGLDKDFWITVALAYTQFLEEKDSYEAARHA